MEFSFSGNPLVPYFLFCVLAYLIVLSAIALVRTILAKWKRRFFWSALFISAKNAVLATALFLALFIALAIFPPVFPESVTSLLGGTIYLVLAFLLGITAAALVPFLVFLGLGVWEIVRAN